MPAALPEIEDWLDERRAIPIGPVSAMGQEQNLLRRFVRDGRPLALGLHVIGDARCQLHSLYAWGSGVALASAVTLSDVLREHPGDAEAQALAFEDRLGAEIEGRHLFSRARDRALQRTFRAEQEPVHADGSHDAIVQSVVPAAEQDPEVFRAFMRWELQLDPVGALADNTSVLERARTLEAQRTPRVHGAALPTRGTLLELIAAACSPDQRRGAPSPG